MRAPPDEKRRPRQAAAPDPTSKQDQPRDYPKDPLAQAGDLRVAHLELEKATVSAYVRADEGAARRLKFLADRVGEEADYLDNVRRGFPIVRQRDNAPKGATLGWFQRHDASVRATRKTLGFDVDGGG